MKKSQYEVWRRYKIIGGIIFLLSSLLLFFSTWLKDIIYHLLQGISFGHSIITIIGSMGLTLNKVLLFFMNWGIIPFIFSHVKNEDERIEKIRNYASKHTLRTMVMLACLVGLIMKDTPNLLIFTLFMQAYYLLLFRLCLYRDSRILYLNEEQMTIYSKNNAKQFTVISTILSSICGGTVAYMGVHYPTHISLVIIISMGISMLFATVQLHWKR
jgi:uncharacterized membrane protein